MRIYIFTYIPQQGDVQNGVRHTNNKMSGLSLLAEASKLVLIQWKNNLEIQNRFGFARHFSWFEDNSAKNGQVRSFPR